MKNVMIVLSLMLVSLTSHALPESLYPSYYSNLAFDYTHSHARIQLTPANPGWICVTYLPSKIKWKGESERPEFSYRGETSIVSRVFIASVYPKNRHQLIHGTVNTPELEPLVAGMDYTVDKHEFTQDRLYFKSANAPLSSPFREPEVIEFLNKTSRTVYELDALKYPQKEGVMLGTLITRTLDRDTGTWRIERGFVRCNVK